MYEDPLEWPDQKCPFIATRSPYLIGLSPELILNVYKLGCLIKSVTSFRGLRFFQEASQWGAWRYSRPEIPMGERYY